MKIEYRIKDKIAPLAWIAEVTGYCCKVTCGTGVEIGDSFFVEGAWDGLFKEGTFTNTDWFCGTGGVITQNGIIFSTPTHVTSGIFMKKCGGGIPF